MAENIRRSNVELMRIAAMCGVVVLHFNGLGALNAVQPGSVNSWLLLALESLCICAVDLFILISGFFLSRTGKRRVIKALDLVLQVMIIGLVRYLLECLLGTSSFRLSSLVRSMVPNNYFVTMYVALYFLSPYLNRMLESLQERQFRCLLILWLGLFCLWPTALDILCAVLETSYDGLYPGGLAGSQHGYSIVNFIAMYLLGAYLQRQEARIQHIPAKAQLILAAVCLLALTLLQSAYPIIARAYCNPLVIVLAVLAFTLLYRVKLQSALVNTLAKSALTCYLCHDFFLRFLISEKIVRGNTLILLIYILLTAAGVYLACWAVWRSYERLMRPLLRRLAKLTEPADKTVSL